MSSGPDLVVRLRTTLATAVEGRADELLGLSPDLSDLRDVLLRAAEGGKLLRPTFCWWGWRAAGGAESDQRIDRAAVAVELVHASALIHDDVIDASDVRRRRPTVHRHFAHVHEGRGWAGSSTAFGMAAAVLAGDLLLAWADQVLRSSGYDPATLARAWPVFDAMRDEVLVGQYLDIAAQAAMTTTVGTAMRVIELKSSRYTVERPLEIGAQLGGATSELIERLAAYARPLGQAFQLRDDLLGVLGNPGTTGKPAGDDIREGKRTVLLALAYESADSRQRETLDRWVGARDLDAAGVEIVREVLADTGAIAASERLIDDRASQAGAALEGVPEPAASALAELIGTLTQRSS